MFSSFDDTARSFFNETCKHKCIWIDIINHVFQFPEFKTGDDGKNNITVIAHFKFAGQKTTFTLVYSDAFVQFIGQLKSLKAG